MARGCVRARTRLETDVRPEPALRDSPSALTQAERLELLLEAGQRLGSTLEPGDIYEHLVTLVRSCMPCDGLIVSSYSSSDGLIRCEHAWVGGNVLDALSLPPIPLGPPGHGMQTEVIRSGEARLFGDVADRVQDPKGTFMAVDPDGSRRDLGPERPSVTQSALMVPVKLEGQVAGVVQVMSNLEGAYTPDHLFLLEGFVAQATAALHNARLYAAARQEIEERQRAERALRESEDRYRRLSEELERRVRERTAELELANRELEGFTYSVSHDLRAPLRAIMSTSMILKEDYGPLLPSEAHDQLTRQARAARRMGDLIDDLLRLSRIGRQELRRVLVDLSDLAQEVASELAEEEARFEVQPGLRAVADPTMLRLALQNLLGNAVKFARDGAAPVVEVGRDGDAFFVRDNGIGFDMRYANKLFQAFERLHDDDRIPGTGIGLANVGRVIERHGGRVWAQSQGPGKGATFFFTLPEPTGSG